MSTITNRDINLMKQLQLKYSLKVEVLENGSVIEVVNGLISGGSVTINASSDVRRTFNMSVVPTWGHDVKVHETGPIWLDKDVHVYIGLTDIMNDEVVWYSQGYYVFQNASAQYDSQNNTLTLTCNDWCAKLNGTKNGQVGALSTLIPAYDIYREYYNDVKSSTSNLPHYDSSTAKDARLQAGDTYYVTADGCYYVCQSDYTWKNIGSSIEAHIKKDGLGIYNVEQYCDDPDSAYHYYAHFKWTVIRESMISILKQLGYVDKLLIDEIGDNNMMPSYTSDWKKNREDQARADFNGKWSTVPYDQEFSCGANVLQMVNALRDLYPNFETFFDIDGVFRCQMIPTCEDDDVTFDNNFIQRILISEQTTIDLTEVKNVCEVWGKVIDVDFYCESPGWSGNTISASIQSYEDEYKNGDKIGIKLPSWFSMNSDGPSLNINGYGNVTIYTDGTDTPLPCCGDDGEPTMVGGQVYVFQIYKKRKNKQDILKCYLMGRYQVHGMDVLTNGQTMGTHTFYPGTSNEKTVPKFSKEYFQTKYNCEVVNFSVVKDSPFIVQKIGEILDVKHGGDFDGITSNTSVIERAVYENWKTSRLTDNITITTLLVPYLDVNVKVSYQRSDKDAPEQYIIKSVNHSFDAGTSSITMMRFYPFMNT